MTIRPLSSTDSLSELTTVVRDAYQRLADSGFRYWGTWQSEDDTRHRCSQGHCLVAEEHGRIVGTVTVKVSRDTGDPDWYRKEGVWVVTQFAVKPGHQGTGLGSRLIIEAEKYAFEQGGLEAAIDTAEGAKHLVDFYARRGYRSVGTVDWEGTNYLSVLMSKRLRPVLTTKRLVLRDLTVDDIPKIQGHWADTRFQAMYPPGRMTPELCYEVFSTEVRALAEYPRQGHHWAIVHGEEFVGSVRLTDERGRVGTLGYGVAPDSWRRGLGTEAVSEVVRYGFEEMGLHRIQAWVYSNNLASQGVMRNLGFVYEGALRERIDWGTHRVDDGIYGLLRSEWRDRQGPA